MRHTLRLFIYSLLATLLLVPFTSVSAQEGPPGNVAESWVMHVDYENQAAFEDAVKGYMAMSKEMGSPYHWEAYVQNTGEHLNAYYFRHCCFAWAERDAFDTWAEENPALQEYWDTNAHPLVKSYGHHFSEVDFENSHWPEEMDDPQFVGVTTYMIKPGKYQKFNGTKEALSQLAINNGWADNDHQWGWTSSVDGERTVSLVIPHENYADMADPDPSFFEFVTGQVGSEEAAAGMFDTMMSATTGTHYEVYAHRPELSSLD